MPWANFDDGYAESPKVEQLSDAAFRLHTTAILYACRNLTDGLIPSAVAKRLTATSRPKIVRELVATRCWIEHPDGFEIHDFLDWNQSRADVENRRAAGAERQRRHRQSRTESHVSNAVTDAVVTPTTPHHTTPPLLTTAESVVRRGGPSRCDTCDDGRWIDNPDDHGTTVIPCPTCSPTTTPNGATP